MRREQAQGRQTTNEKRRRYGASDCFHRIAESEPDALSYETGAAGAAGTDPDHPAADPRADPLSSGYREVGTAIGYSTLYMREYAPADCEIVSIEKDPEREKRAEQNVHAYAAETKAQRGGRTEDGLEKAGRDGGAAAEKSKEADDGRTPGAGLTGGGGAEQGEGPDCRITLIEGDAAAVLKNLAEQDGRRFDFVFMDAAKGQYIHFLPMVKALLAPGGVLLSDNVLKGGEILEPRYAVTRRNRTIHRRMREYLEALTSDPELSTVVLATGDGAAMSVRRIPVEDGSFHGPIPEKFRTGISSADDV